MRHIDRIHWIPAVHGADCDGPGARWVLRDSHKSAGVSRLERSIDRRRDVSPGLLRRRILFDDSVIDHIRSRQIVERYIQTAVRIDDSPLRRRRIRSRLHGERPCDRLAGERRPCLAVIGAHIHGRRGEGAHIDGAGILLIEQHPLHAVVVGRRLNRETGHLRPCLRVIFAHPEPVLPRTHHQLIRFERVDSKPLPGRAPVAVGAHLEWRVVRVEGRTAILRNQKRAATRVRIHPRRNVEPIRIRWIQRNTFRTVQVVLVRRMRIRQRRPCAVPGIPSIHAANVRTCVNQARLSGMSDQTGNISSSDNGHRLVLVGFGSALRQKLRRHSLEKQEYGQSRVDPAKTQHGESPFRGVKVRELRSIVFLTGV